MTFFALHLALGHHPFFAHLHDLRKGNQRFRFLWPMINSCHKFHCFSFPLLFSEKKACIEIFALRKIQGKYTPQKFNIVRYRKWPYLKEDTCSKPSFWVCMLVFGDAIIEKFQASDWLHFRLWCLESLSHLKPCSGIPILSLGKVQWKRSLKPTVRPWN